MGLTKALAIFLRVIMLQNKLPWCQNKPRAIIGIKSCNLVYSPNKHVIISHKAEIFPAKELFTERVFVLYLFEGFHKLAVEK